MSTSDEWGAQPAMVAPLWRPPPPPARDEDGQFSDAGASSDEGEAWGAASSLQTVVVAPGWAAVPRLALRDMVATRQPVAVAADSSWQALSQLSLEQCSSAVSVSLEDSPRSAAGTASVSLRSYLAADLAAADLTDSETLDQLAELADTPRTVRQGASVSPAAQCSDSSDAAADLTDCETLDQLAELADTPRTVRQGASVSPAAQCSDSSDAAAASAAGTGCDPSASPGSRGDTAGHDTAGTVNGHSQKSAARHPEPYRSDCRETRVCAVLPHSGGVTSKWSVDTSEQVAACGRPVEAAGVSRSVVTAGSLAMLSESCGGGTVTSLVMQLAAAAEAMPPSVHGLGSGGDAAVERGGGAQHVERLDPGSRSADSGHCRAVTTLTDRGNNDAAATSSKDGGRAKAAPSLTDRRRSETVPSASSVPSVADSGYRSETVPSASSVPSVADSGRGHQLPSVADNGYPSETVPSASSVPSVADSGRGVMSVRSLSDSGSGPDWTGLCSADCAAVWPSDASRPPAAATEQAGLAADDEWRSVPPCPVHGSAGRRRALKRSPARRLSFTLDSPSPLLVEYYMKHPEERLQVLKNASSIGPERVDAAEPLPGGQGDSAALRTSAIEEPPPGGQGDSAALPTSAIDDIQPASCEERPRRRWADDSASPAELRTALASCRHSDEYTVRGSPRPEQPPAAAAAAAAAVVEWRRPCDVSLGWGTVLHSLSAAQLQCDTAAAAAAESGLPPLQQPSPAARPARWRHSAPAPPPTTLELSPRPAGSPSGRRRRPRVSPRLRRTPPALSPLTLPSRPTPNFDSHAIQEIVQGRSPGRPDVGWGTPSPPRPSPPRGQAAGNAPASDPPATATQDIFRLPALDELRHLLALHERQMTALVEQQRRQRRALEAACRRREEALLQRLRRQLAAAELLAGPPADSRPPSPPLPADERPYCTQPAAGGDGPAEPPQTAAQTARSDYRDAQLTYRRSPLSPPTARQSAAEWEVPSAYERYESQLSTPPARDRPLRPAATAADAVPTPVARRLASPPAVQHPVIVPPEVLEPAMQARYAMVTAAARGYLTRRLMRTEKVQSLIVAAKESMMCALRLQREVDLTKQVTKQDVELHERLVNQVRGACYSLHQLFIAASPHQRLAVIAADRVARAHAAERRRSGDPAGRLSHATQLSLQRKKNRETAAAAAAAACWDTNRPMSASGWARPRLPVGSPRTRQPVRPAAISVSPKPRSSPSGRPRRVTAHSPRAGSRSSLVSERAAATGGRASRTARSLVQLGTIYAPNPVRRAKSSQLQLPAGYGCQSQAGGEPKQRRQRAGRVWR